MKKVMNSLILVVLATTVLYLGKAAWRSEDTFSAGLLGFIVGGLIGFVLSLEIPQNKKGNR